ncbi:hypothetical protein INP83_05520 [Mucilaginibacter sp. 21P]|uniref:hypothetical protein n=1 Tax=Mucilaginibacter sp. 21P TaxID=2778902 RepID=UPI001C59E9BD|nr:hypothetical protein [Mucilaginibacter sp. 21P]QXV66544.1 hypothetical protein INP83_05520 [Mucilaginibacter sp. 21P]
MAEQAGLHKIQSLRRRWVTYQVLEAVLFAAYAALYVGAITYYFISPKLLWGILTFPIALSLILLLRKPWQMSDKKIAAFLDKEYPELQESTQLLLIPAQQQNTLQQLASAKAAETLSNLKVSHKPFAKKLAVAFVALLVATGFIWAMGELFYVDQILYTHDRDVAFCAPEKPEVLLPQVKGVHITITPPAYISRTPFTWDKFNITINENASLRWDVKTNVSVKALSLIFNDVQELKLQPSADGKEWVGSKQLSKPGFYQVKVDGKLSDLYRIIVLKDAPPVIHIKTPKTYTYIDAGEVQRVNISATVDDDHGIINAQLVATVAKGRGEGVKFTEYKIPFAEEFRGQKTKYDLAKLIDLPSLKMEPGDELYFYLQAQDTYHQQSRSDVFKVSIQDTAELLSMTGMVAGSSLKPEFFRSERQIIIDAEQLLKDKDSISAEKFNIRSNNLAIDQKLLRLRYGKFLGEEAEDEIGKGNNDLDNPEDFSNAKKILKEYTDDHDNADDAGLFEPTIKAQLKATLTEMWKAELQLRLYKPAAALPFAYKALRLLKDLQQKSRAYVAKTAYNPPPLKMEKRLSGELDKVTSPTDKQEIKATADRQAALRNAVAVLQDLKKGMILNATQKHILQLADQKLSENASAQPGVYLQALNAMRRVLATSAPKRTDIELVERAIQKSLSPLKPAPTSAQSPADMGLSKQYFKNLKALNR